MLKNDNTQVVSADFRQPYTPFVLANSLESIGVEFHRANAIARKLGQELQEKKVSLITRSDLRQVAYEKIKKELGKITAERYVKFRKFMNIKKPLILMLGGSTGSGKNTVAVELAHRLDIVNVITTDVLREVMRAFFSREVLPVIHTSSYLAGKKLWMPLEEGKDQATVAFREQALRVNAGIKSIIKRSVKEKMSVIINGVHVLPGIIKPSDFKKANLAEVFIYIESEKEHKKRFYIRGLASEERGAQKYIDNFESIRSIQDYILELSKKHNYLCIDNLDSRRTAVEIIDYIVDKFRYCQKRHEKMKKE